MKKIFMAIALCLIAVLNCYAEENYNAAINIHVGDSVSIDAGASIFSGRVTYITPAQINIEFDGDTFGFEYFYIDGVFDYTNNYRVSFSHANNTNPDFYKSYTYKKMPSFIQNDYEQAQKCIRVGKIMVSIGAPLFVIGTITYCVGLRDMNTTACGVGGSIMGLGSTCIGVSIPLFCFGSAIKNSCTRDYKLYLNN